LPAGTDLVVVPGGFSYGDYLRCGAIAGRSPVMKAIVSHASKGGLVLGVCNGFQILTEAGLLPGALMRNAGLKFVCRSVRLKVENNSTFFTRNMARGDVVTCPVAHHDGNYFADAETLKALEGNGQVVFRYAGGTNPNGAINDIAGIMNKAGNVIGMMPHPENMIEPLHGSQDCLPLFESLAA
jgi:phosphoribosylformylglycinamidine synthase subunit PurQ / glutaminase